METENKPNNKEVKVKNKTSYEDLEKLCKDNNISTECITTVQMAKLLNVTPTTVISYTKQGKIKTISTVGGRRRIPITVAEEFIREHYKINDKKVEKEQVEIKKENDVIKKQPDAEKVIKKVEQKSKSTIKKQVKQQPKKSISKTKK